MSHFSSKTWKPLEDPDKPAVPYTPGFQVRITSHKPPPPMGRDFPQSEEPPLLPDKWLYTNPMSKHVIAYPPVETGNVPNPDVADLTISQSIAVGDKLGPQIVICDIKFPDKRPPVRKVAKIFDALYWNPLAPLTGEPSHVTHWADVTYSLEAAAHEIIRERGLEGLTPEYSGSWTFNQKITVDGEEHLRGVRLILMEYFEGKMMEDLMKAQVQSPYDEKTRLKVLATALDYNSRLQHSGLYLPDFKPDNILLVSNPGERVPRVVIINFCTSVRLDKVMCTQEPPWERQTLPFNPIFLFWDMTILSNFKDWAPGALYKEWLVSEFGSTEKRKGYSALSKEWLEEEFRSEEKRKGYESWLKEVKDEIQELKAH